MSGFMPIKSPWDPPAREKPGRATNCGPAQPARATNRQYMPVRSPWARNEDGQPDLSEETERAAELIAAIRQLQQRISQGNQEDGNPGLSADEETALREEIEGLKRELLALALPARAAENGISAREVVENGRRRLDIYVPARPSQDAAPLVDLIIEATSPPGERLFMAPKPLT